MMGVKSLLKEQCSNSSDAEDKGLYIINIGVGGKKMAASKGKVFLCWHAHKVGG